MSSKNEAAEREAQRRREVEALTAQRLRGPTEPRKYPGELVHDVYPIVDECALFVSRDELLPPSAETFGDARRDNKQQATRLSGLATFLQMIGHPLAGKVSRVNATKGTIMPSHSYDMTTGPDSSVLAPKVEVHMVLMLFDESKPIVMGNISGILFRATVRDYDFSFADALYATILTNQAAQTNFISPDSGQEARRVLSQLSQPSPAKDLVDQDLSRTMIYDIMRRPERYRRVLLDWAKAKRAVEIDRRQIDEINKARSKRVHELRSEPRRPRKDDEPAGPPPVIDEAMVLTPAEERSIKERAKADVEVDPRVGVNALLTILSMNATRSEGRAQIAESLMRASTAEYASMCVAGRSVTEPSTQDDQLDVACYQTASLIKFVEAVYANALDDTARLRELSSLARSMDNGDFNGAALAKSDLNPRKVLTMRSQLDMAYKYGTDPGLCDSSRYYCMPKDPLMPGEQYDPMRELDTVTFLPNDVFPDFGRTPEQRADILGAAPATEERLAPYFSRSPGPRLAYTMPRISSFEELRKYRLPFTESTLPDDVDKAHKNASAASSVERQIVRSAVNRLHDMMDAHENSSLVNNDGDDGDGVAAMAIDNADVVGSMSRMFSDKESRDRDALVVDMQAETDIMQLMSEGIGRADMLAQMGVDDPKKLDERNAVMRRQAEEREARLRELHFEGFVEPPRQSEIGTVKYYRSNWTMMRERLSQLANKMHDLSYMDPSAYLQLMPRMRDYCLMTTARLHLSDAYNNGAVMRGAREFDRNHWHDPSMRAGSGAYMRKDAITADLSWFGNSMLSDMVALRTMRNVTVGTFLLTDMLATRYIMADNTATAKLNQLLLSKAGDGKSRFYGIFAALCVLQTMRSRMVQSLQAGVDAQASDDHLDYYDEAPSAVSSAGRNLDPVARQQENILRTTTGSGQVSGARSCHGDYTVEFVADSKNTTGMASNILLRPPNFELSMHSRLEIRRLPDELNSANQMLYEQHKKMPVALEARKRQLELYFRNFHALQLLAAKASMMYGLPTPDTTVVSCFLGPVMERVERYYPRWMEAMRASNRVMLRCRGYAVYNALHVVFGSPFSQFAPENNPSGYNPGFDVMHLAPCAPFMCATVEQLMMAIIWGLEEAVCTDMHKLMYALATSAGFTAKSMEDLFVFGGPDHRDTPSANTGRNTRSVPTGAAANVTPVMRQAAEYGKRVDEMSPVERLRRHARLARAHSELVDGEVVEFNRHGEPITDDLKAALGYEMAAHDFYTAQSDEGKRVLTEEADGTKLCYAIGGWRPEHWRRTYNEMPEFWKAGRRQLEAFEKRNNQDLREQHVVTFAPNKTGGTFNPNYIRVRLDETRDLTAVFERAMGSHPLSRVNITYMMDLYASDQRAVTMELPQLASSQQNTSQSLRWLIGAGNIIQTRKIPVVVFPKNVSYIDISTVWLFTGGYHNHLMSMYTFFEDQFVPDGGQNLLMPLQNPEAPELLYSFRLRPCENRVLCVSNPEYVEPEISTITAAAMPARECDSTYFSMLDERSADDRRQSMGESMAARVATAALNAISHGPMREHTNSMTTEEREFELRIVAWRLHIERIHAAHAHACARADASNSPHPPTPALPPRPERRFDADSCSPAAFFAPNKPIVSFMDCSADEQLSRVFHARTGQKPSCTVMQVEAALAANTRAMSGLVTSHAQDLRAHVSSMILDTELTRDRRRMPYTQQYQSLDGDDDMQSSHNDSERSEQSVNVSVVDYVSRIHQASAAMDELSKHRQRALAPYPEGFISGGRRRPEWITTDMRDAPVPKAEPRAVEKAGPVEIIGEPLDLDGFVRLAFINSGLAPVGGPLPAPIDALSPGDLPLRADIDDVLSEKSGPHLRDHEPDFSDDRDDLVHKDAAVHQGQRVADELARKPAVVYDPAHASF